MDVTNLTDPIDISIPLVFGGPQPNAYGVEPASSQACSAGELVGDTRRGGSCNFEQYSFIPHCNGTHTECVGHITHERISIRECLQDVIIPAILVTVAPKAIANGDMVITRESLRAVEAFRVNYLERPTALIVRTLPNDDSKLSRRYGDTVPPYFAADAIEFIVDEGFAHLLVDLPSIDRIYDEGRLANHRIFWDVAPGSFEIGRSSRFKSTITELIYVPGEVPDGEYLLNLQIAPFAADASPSRPLLFPMH